MLFTFLFKCQVWEQNIYSNIGLIIGRKVDRLCGHVALTHGLAVLPGLVLLEVPAPELPGHHEPLPVPEVVGGLGSALGRAANNPGNIAVTTLTSDQCLRL